MLATGVIAGGLLVLAGLFVRFATRSAVSQQRGVQRPHGGQVDPSSDRRH
jgi:hypothetical protein